MRSLSFCFYGLTLISLTFAQGKSSSVSDAINKFSFQLLSETIKEKSNEPNIIIGPYTVWAALSILNEGAGGKTESELRNVLNIPEQDSERGQFRESQKDIVKNIVHTSDGITLDAVNDIFASNEVNIDSKYQELVKNTYGVTVDTLDFKNNADYAAKTINDKISAATRGRIPNVVNAADVRTAKMYITSALFFKGLWAQPFKRIDEKKPFYDERGTVIDQVAMMRVTDEFSYGELFDGKAEAVKIPYKGDRLFMIILLPTANNSIESVLNSMKTASIQDIVGKLGNIGDVHVTLPKFKINTDITLNNALQEMGIREVFGANSNLHKMSPDPLGVSTVLHKAQIEVDEMGTVASAVTVVQIVTLSYHVPTLFEANKPFLYFVYDKETQSVLFAGKVSNPKNV